MQFAKQVSLPPLSAVATSSIAAASAGAAAATTTTTELDSSSQNISNIGGTLRSSGRFYPSLKSYVDALKKITLLVFKTLTLWTLTVTTMYRIND